MIPNGITRRNWFTSATVWTGAALAAAQMTSGATEKYPRNLTKEDVDRWMTELSNWGKWGPYDQAGTINLITPAKRKAAAALVKEGVPVSASLDADLPKEGTTDVPLQVIGPRCFADGSKSLPLCSKSYPLAMQRVAITVSMVLRTVTPSLNGENTAQPVHAITLFNGFPH